MTPSLRFRTLIGLLLGAILAGGCATYTERTAEALADFRSGHFAASREAYADEAVTGSEFLSGVEAGTVALTAGDWRGAQGDLERGAAQVREIEERALISASDLGESLSSWVLNDTLLPYPGEGFERVYLHVLLGLAYLGQGQVESVLVEARRANQLLEREEELYDKQYRAGGLGHFLSAVAYELTGEPGEAWIDYERMLAKEVGTELAGRALVRLAHDLGREEELPRLEARFGADFERPAEAASIVLLGGLGLAPFKREILLPIPTGDGLLQWAVPEFVSSPGRESALLLEVLGGERPLRSVELESVDEVARENLSDRIAWLVAKGTARTLLKRELAQQLGRDHGFLGQLAGDLFTFVTERADLRSWRTLPATWHGGRLYVPAGSHQLRLSAEGGGWVELGGFELDAGETMFVLARAFDGKLFAQVLGGRPLGRAPASAAGEAPSEIRAPLP